VRASDVTERQRRGAAISSATLGLLMPPAPLLRRHALERRLDGVFGKRLTVVVADAGFGKSSLLNSWVSDVVNAWYTLSKADQTVDTLARGLTAVLHRALPGSIGDELAFGPSGTEDPAAAEAFAAILAESLHQRLRHDLVLVLDDVQEIGDAAASARLIESLCRQAPPTLHLVLCSRADPPFPIDRLRGQGGVLEIAGPMLAFDVEELDQLVSASLGRDGRQLAQALAALTGGWPAAVRLALDALERLPAGSNYDEALERLRRPGGELYGYLAREAFATDPFETRELLRRLSCFERVPVELCEALGVAAGPEALPALVKRGLAAEMRDGGFALHQLVREFVLHAWPLEQDETRELHRRAAAWFAAQGRIEEALRSLADGDDAEERNDLVLGRASWDPLGS